MGSQIHDHPDNREIRAHSPSASVVQVESSKLLPLLVILALLSGSAIGIGVFAIVYAKSADTEARMLQYYLLELDARVIRAGIKDSDDAIASKLAEDGKK